MPSGRYGIGCGVILDKLDDTQQGCGENNNNEGLYALRPQQWSYSVHINQYYIGGLVQDQNISITNTLEILQSCTNPSILRTPWNMRIVLLCFVSLWLNFWFMVFRMIHLAHSSVFSPWHLGNHMSAPVSVNNPEEYSYNNYIKQNKVQIMYVLNFHSLFFTFWQCWRHIQRLQTPYVFFWFTWPQFAEYIGNIAKKSFLISGKNN